MSDGHHFHLRLLSHFAVFIGGLGDYFVRIMDFATIIVVGVEVGLRGSILG